MAAFDLLSSSRLAGAAVALLFYSGPVLMHLVRERVFGSRLFYGTHARVDRLGLARGIALARRQRGRRPGAGARPSDYRAQSDARGSSMASKGSARTTPSPSNVSTIA